MKKCILLIIIIGLATLVFLVITDVVIAPKINPNTISIDNSMIVYSLMPYGFSILNNNYSYIGYWELQVPIRSFITKQYAGYIVPFFTWSVDGQSIVGRVSDSSPVGGYPVVIHQNGDIDTCPVSKSYWGNYRAWMVMDNLILTDTFIDTEAVILYDMKKCSLSQILYTAGEDSTIEDPVLSQNGYLAFEQYKIGRDFSENELIVLNPDGTQGVSILGGKNPIWSKNGNLLIYIDKNGNIVSHNIENDKISVLSIMGVAWDTMTSISDDEQYLIYNGVVDEKMTLVLLDLNTLDYQLLGEGYYPNWRWDN